MAGKVYLIGAGPGDPGLITLRGAQLLARCDVVLYDGLSNSALLTHAPDAQHVSVGKHGQSRIWRQSEIIDEMLSHAQAGRTVARLKGGDPAVFARTSEEVDALRQASISFEIVPGITAALAAGSYAGIPVTHRRLASAVALVTGHEEPDKAQSALDWEALARFPGTLVVYMGVTTAETWTGALINAGKDPSTPTALIRRCSLPDQQTIHCRLDEATAKMTPASKFRPPVVAIIGAVTELAPSMDWAGRRPLSGQTVLVSRPIDQADALAEPLRELGAHVLIQPALSIGPPEDWKDVDEVIRSLQAKELLIFCSVNGVESFLARLMERHGDMRTLGGVRIAAVGEKTAAALAKWSLRADIVPPDFRARSLGAQLVEQIELDSKPQRITIVRASRGSDELSEMLVAAGAIVRQVVAYSHQDVTEPDPEILAAAEAGRIDWITVTSSATAQNLRRLLGPAMMRSKIASLSPVTSATLADLGINVDVQADPYTMEALVAAIVTPTQPDQEMPSGNKP